MFLFPRATPVEKPIASGGIHTPKIISYTTKTQKEKRENVVVSARMNKTENHGEKNKKRRPVRWENENLAI